MDGVPWRWTSPKTSIRVERKRSRQGRGLVNTRWLGVPGRRKGWHGALRLAMRRECQVIQRHPNLQRRPNRTSSSSLMTGSPACSEEESVLTSSCPRALVTEAMSTLEDKEHEDRQRRTKLGAHAIDANLRSTLDAAQGIGAIFRAPSLDPPSHLLSRARARLQPWLGHLGISSV